MTQSTGFFKRCSYHWKLSASQSGEIASTSHHVYASWLHVNRSMMSQRAWSDSPSAARRSRVESVRSLRPCCRSEPRHYTLQPQCKQSYFQPWRCAEQSHLMASYWSALLSNLSRSLASSLSPYLQPLFEKLLYIRGQIRWCIREKDLRPCIIEALRFEIIKNLFFSVMKMCKFGAICTFAKQIFKNNYFFKKKKQK